MENNYYMGRKLWEKEKLLVFHSYVSLVCQNEVLFGNRLLHNTDTKKEGW